MRKRTRKRRLITTIATVTSTTAMKAAMKAAMEAAMMVIAEGEAWRTGSVPVAVMSLPEPESVPEPVPVLTAWMKASTERIL